jgi:hypothetical protein
MSSVGFNGIIFSKGGGLLGSFLSVSIFVTGRDELTVTIWPGSKSLTERIRFIELRRKARDEASAVNSASTRLLGNS